jgi:hypothetical protein
MTIESDQTAEIWDDIAEAREQVKDLRRIAFDTGDVELAGFADELSDSLTRISAFLLERPKVDVMIRQSAASSPSETTTLPV